MRKEVVISLIFLLIVLTGVMFVSASENVSYKKIAKIECDNQSQEVYNIKVENYHDYFAEGILVHNKLTTTNSRVELRTAEDGIGEIYQINGKTYLVDQNYYDQELIVYDSESDAALFVDSDGKLKIWVSGEVVDYDSTHSPIFTNKQTGQGYVVSFENGKYVLRDLLGYNDFTKVGYYINDQGELISVSGSKVEKVSVNGYKVLRNDITKKAYVIDNTEGKMKIRNAVVVYKDFDKIAGFIDDNGNLKIISETGIIDIKSGVIVDKYDAYNFYVKDEPGIWRKGVLRSNAKPSQIYPGKSLNGIDNVPIVYIGADGNYWIRFALVNGNGNIKYEWVPFDRNYKSSFRKRGYTVVEDGIIDDHGKKVIWDEQKGKAILVDAKSGKEIITTQPVYPKAGGLATNVQYEFKTSDGKTLTGTIVSQEVNPTTGKWEMQMKVDGIDQLFSITEDNIIDMAPQQSSTSNVDNRWIATVNDKGYLIRIPVSNNNPVYQKLTQMNLGVEVNEILWIYSKDGSGNWNLQIKPFSQSEFDSLKNNPNYIVRKTSLTPSEGNKPTTFPIDIIRATGIRAIKWDTSGNEIKITPGTPGKDYQVSDNGVSLGIPGKVSSALGITSETLQNKKLYWKLSQDGKLTVSINPQSTGPNDYYGESPIRQVRTGFTSYIPRIIQEQFGIQDGEIVTFVISDNGEISVVKGNSGNKGVTSKSTKKLSEGQSKPSSISINSDGGGTIGVPVEVINTFNYGKQNPIFLKGNENPIYTRQIYLAKSFLDKLNIQIKKGDQVTWTVQNGELVITINGVRINNAGSTKITQQSSTSAQSQSCSPAVCIDTCNGQGELAPNEVPFNGGPYAGGLPNGYKLTYRDSSGKIVNAQVSKTNFDTGKITVELLDSDGKTLKNSDKSTKTVDITPDQIITNPPAIYIDSKGNALTLTSSNQKLLSQLTSQQISDINNQAREILKRNIGEKKGKDGKPISSINVDQIPNIQNAVILSIDLDLQMKNQYSSKPVIKKIIFVNPSDYSRTLSLKGKPEDQIISHKKGDLLSLTLSLTSSDTYSGTVALDYKGFYEGQIIIDAANNKWQVVYNSKTGKATLKRVCEVKTTTPLVDPKTVPKNKVIYAVDPTSIVRPIHLQQLIKFHTGIEVKEEDMYYDPVEELALFTLNGDSSKIWLYDVKTKKTTLLDKNTPFVYLIDEAKRIFFFRDKNNPEDIIGRKVLFDNKEVMILYDDTGVYEIEKGHGYSIDPSKIKPFDKTKDRTLEDDQGGKLIVKNGQIEMEVPENYQYGTQILSKPIPTLKSLSQEDYVSYSYSKEKLSQITKFIDTDPTRFLQEYKKLLMDPDFIKDVQVNYFGNDPIINENLVESISQIDDALKQAVIDQTILSVATSEGDFSAETKEDEKGSTLNIARNIKIKLNDGRIVNLEDYNPSDVSKKDIKQRLLKEVAKTYLEELVHALEHRFKDGNYYLSQGMMSEFEAWVNQNLNGGTKQQTLVFLAEAGPLSFLVENGKSNLVDPYFLDRYTARVVFVKWYNDVYRNQFSPALPSIGNGEYEVDLNPSLEDYSTDDSCSIENNPPTD